ncbi:TetR/AcrR family transcriptional regulator [Burkholderia multivorans]|uniref:TetR/AcrR family transcriptional regulator n=1 Tax=Burkholderia multivorans TaxID=87883 RepID=UPI0019D1BC98|nr:TetR/AcrR family transcriptional regulator [Burkholderia multivorans]MBN6731275.1 TetR/AcrR family transcriptional regulator [Burkholderia multivorans]MBN6733455.1 TetR/AcrR family transcriptional regulator [Burkholderia multivorans]MBN7130372.1 TetR/AcrR family transcriptional regulator [Burkholderia multivorans]MBN8165089.1 TetR/AcrR family transcriptional regulator [Burkholderia multivorans]MBN8170878.1 TetR/AcrR family transcriptional regulator [Burkholderia multivorans]
MPKPSSAETLTVRRRARPEGANKAERRRTEIIAAAVKLFSARGYSATSVNDIGEEVGLLPGSLYYHIRSKEDLLYEILLELHTFALDEMNRVDAEGGDPVTRLRRLVRNHVINHDALRIRLFETEFHHLDEKRHAQILAMRKKYLAYVVKLIRKAQAEGLCDVGVNPDAVGLAILGLLNSMPQWFHSRGKISIEQMADSVDRLVVGGLGADPALLKQKP